MTTGKTGSIVGAMLETGEGGNKGRSWRASCLEGDHEFVVLVLYQDHQLTWRRMGIFRRVSAP